MLNKIAQLLGIKTAQKKDFASRRILIVDDNQTDRVFIQRTVEKMGHYALIAENGKIGFQIAKEEKPDLILSDCRMPEMDGVEMCKRLKEDPETESIPFVFLTNVETPATIIECFDMGAENYVCKPINPKLLTSQIETIFNEHLASN